MPLYVVATPIGNNEDLSPRARRILSECHTIIGEEPKETRRLLKALGLELKPIESLNEHSLAEDLPHLLELCRQHEVALISDCGTPGFCDPGADLVARCRASDIEVHSVPGPASITAFLSICGQRLDQFLFRGFLPANTEERREALKKLRDEKLPTLVMDTPYRLGRLLSDIAEILPDRVCSIGLDLSTPDEAFFRGAPAKVLEKIGDRKAEFIMLLEPAPKSGHQASDGRSFSRKKSR